MSTVPGCDVTAVQQHYTGSTGTFAFSFSFFLFTLYFLLFCVKESARGVRDRMQKATRICRNFLCSSLFGAIEDIKSMLVACGVPCGFLDLDCDSHSIEMNANTLWKSKTIIWKVLMGVFETKTSESDTRSIIGLEPAKQAVEKHRSDLLAASERNADLKIFSPAEIAGVARRLMVIEMKRSVFNELHEYLDNPSVLRSLLSWSISRQ